MPRVTIWMISALLWTVAKVGPRWRPKRHQAQSRAKRQIKAFPRVASAKVVFPSHSGIALFAKVRPEVDPSHLKKLTIHPARLDHLYICDACDSEGVPDLVRSSGRHTEEHHLIRCLAPENAKGKALPTEERLTVIEGRLDGMQTQLDDLTGHMGGLASRVGELNGTVGDLTSRIGNIEQLLHRLLAAGASGNAA